MSAKKIARPDAARRDARTDRLPPHDEAAERGVAGSILLDPSPCLDQLDELGLQPEWFYCLPVRKVVETARAMHFRQPPVPVDAITIQTELRQVGLLDQVGGPAFLAQLQNETPSAAHLTAYAATVREFWQMRVAVAAATGIVADVYALNDGQRPGDTVSDVLDEALTQLQRLAELHTHRQELRIKPLLTDRVMPKLDRHYNRGRAQITGLVTTGLEYLDKIFCGLGGENGNYHVFAARPNVGKTSLITGMALHAALDYVWFEELSVEEVAERNARLPEGQKIEVNKEGRYYVRHKGVPVGISSLEMSSDSLAFKMLFQRALADLQLWRTGYAKQEDFDQLGLAAGKMAAPNNILIDDTARDTIESIKAKWRRWHRTEGIRFFMLDYLQLIKSSHTARRPDRVQEMEEISAEIQALGKELNCPMAILCQLNRDYEKEPTRLPRLSDLKNCGAIEQDADSVTLLYKPSPYKPFSKELTSEHEFFITCIEAIYKKKRIKETGNPNWEPDDDDNVRKWTGRPERINALIEKNKHGPKGDAKLLFLKSSTLFVDYDAWLKENKFRGPSKGEESRYRQNEDTEPELPKATP